LDKSRLIDHIRALNHRRSRRRGSLGPGNVSRGLNDFEPTSFELVEVLQLMLKSELPEQLRPGIGIDPLGHFPFGLFAIEREDVLADKEVRDVVSKVHEVERAVAHRRLC
jgi:hypothetical protein